MEKPTILTQRTLVPVGIVTIVFGASMWLTSVWKQGEANAAQIQEIKLQHDKNIDKVYQQLEKISDKLDRLIEKTGN